MEYLGLLGLLAAFICVMKLNEVPDEMASLKRKIKKLEKAVFGDKERKNMSRLIEELQGKWCKIDSDDFMNKKVQICDVDEEWVKVMYQESGRKDEGKDKIKIIRVDSIDSIEVLGEDA